MTASLVGMSAVMRRESPTVAARPGETKERILDAADRLLGRLGYRKMTLDDLAKEARLGRRTLYLHFESKEEIALAAIDRLTRRVLGELEVIAAEVAPPEDRLRRMLEARVVRRVAALTGYHEALDDIFEALRPTYLDRRRGHDEAEAELFSRVLVEGARTGQFAFDPPLEMARILVSATNALLPLGLTPRDLGTPEELLTTVRRMAALLVRGTMRPATTPQVNYYPLRPEDDRGGPS